MHILLNEYASLLHGGLIVIELAAGLLTIGFFMGLVLAGMEVYGSRPVSFIATATQKTIRGIPALVMLMLGYFGVTAFVDMDPLWVAMLVLGIRSSAYQSQLFRGAIQSIGSSQMDAARAIGMSKMKALRYIIIPQALRLSIGPWTNEYSAEVKDTSLAYAIGVLDILRRGRFIINYSRGNALLIYCAIAIFYFVIIRAGNMVLYRLERKLAVPGFERRNP